MKRILSNIDYKSFINTANLAVLAVLTSVVFREYLSGKKSPSWDFLGDYLTNAISWWNLGSFFSPANYVPYAFSGYPAYLSAQSSGWYLPYVVLDQFNLISSHPLAIIQVITIFFGIAGFFFFSKSWNIKTSIALVLSVGYLFTPGFFTSASHIDIVRAWAFMPWMLLALKPRGKHTPLTVFATGLLGFQYLIGVYPGVIIASVYIFVIYIPLLIWIFKPSLKEYFLFQLLPMGAGSLLSLIKWLPFIFEERLFRGGNTVVVNQGILSTLIYPYQTTILPNDITMRSIFIAPLLVVSILLIKKITKPISLFAVIAIMSIIFGFDFNQTNPWQNSLPLLGESRFRTTDFKLFITIATLMISGFAIQQAVIRGISLLHGAIALTSAFGYFWLINLLAKNGGLLSDMLKPGNLIARIAGISFLLILVILILKNYTSFKFLDSATVGTLLLVTLGLGWYWALQSPAVWSNDRVAAEEFYYGETSGEINKRVRDYEPTFREARSGPSFPVPYPAELTFQTWNKAEIEKSFTLGGLVSLKGVTRYENLLEIAMTERGVSYFELLRLPLTVWVVDKDKADLEAADCIFDGSCVNSNVQVRITNWKPDEYSVSISNSAKGLLITNEVAWNGWQAKVCNSVNCNTQVIATGISDKFVAVAIDSSTESVIFSYKQPFKTQSWVTFWLGAVLLFLLSLLIWRNNNDKSRFKS